MIFFFCYFCPVVLLLATGCSPNFDHFWPFVPQFRPGYFQVDEESMTSIALDLRVLGSHDQQGHLAYVLGDLAKARIAHIALRDPVTSIVQQRTNLGLCVTSPSPTPNIRYTFWTCWMFPSFNRKIWKHLFVDKNYTSIYIYIYIYSF